MLIANNDGEHAHQARLLAVQRALCGAVIFVDPDDHLDVTVESRLPKLVYDPESVETEFGAGGNDIPVDDSRELTSIDPHDPCFRIRRLASKGANHV